MSIQVLSGLPRLPGVGGLEKLEIRYETLASRYFGSISALFNPNELRYDQKVDWKFSSVLAQSGVRQSVAFQASPPATLSLDLFFDTYEGDPDGGLFGGSLLKQAAAHLLMVPGLASPSATNVVTHTDKFIELARVNRELHRPPFCELHWGRQLLLHGVLTQINHAYSYFMEDGTPVRARLGCTFQEVPTEASVRARENHSADVAKKRVVRRGDTLSRIAHDEYNDASLWRVLARANGIEDPRALTPGRVLSIPPLRK